MPRSGVGHSEVFVLPSNVFDSIRSGEKADYLAVADIKAL